MAMPFRRDAGEEGDVHLLHADVGAGGGLRLVEERLLEGGRVQLPDEVDAVAGGGQDRDEDEGHPGRAGALFMPALLTASRRRRASGRRSGRAARRRWRGPFASRRGVAEAVLAPELGAERLEDAARRRARSGPTRSRPAGRLREAGEDALVVACPDDREVRGVPRHVEPHERAGAAALALAVHHAEDARAPPLRTCDGSRRRARGWCGRPRPRTRRRAPAAARTRGPSDSAASTRVSRSAFGPSKPKPWATFFSTSGRSPFELADLPRVVAGRPQRALRTRGQAGEERRHGVERLPAEDPRRSRARVEDQRHGERALVPLERETSSRGPRRSRGRAPPRRGRRGRRRPGRP